MDIHELSMDNPWISMDIRESFSWPNGTPLKLRALQPDQSRWLFRASLCKFWVFVSCHLFICMNGHFIYVGRNPWPTKDTFGSSWDFQGQFWRYSVFKWLSKKSPNHETRLFECFPLQFPTKLGAIDAQSMPGHFPNFDLVNLHSFPSKKTNKLRLADSRYKYSWCQSIHICPRSQIFTGQTTILGNLREH